MTNTSSHRTPPTARGATSADLPTITATLASAFADDPLMAWLLGRTDRAEQRLAPLFRAVASRALHESGAEVHVADDAKAAAIWKDVGCWKATPAHLLHVMPGMIRSFRWRSALLVRGLATVERLHPEEPHRYLSCLGTHQAAQGAGLGASVLAPMLQRCDDEGIPVYAESSNPRNLAFYHRHGFVEHGDPIEPCRGAPLVYPIWRAPR
jgi:GNAT superfamily N-acetyltransferase